MHNVREIKKDVFLVGVSDRRIELFENAFPVPNGISYNAYLILDKKTVLIDTADKSVEAEFFENLEYALNGRKLDYVIVSHAEPDHSSSLRQLIMLYPRVKIVGTAKTAVFLKQFFDFDIDSGFIAVKDGDTLKTGLRSLTFATAPMVHWPEVMVTYDAYDKALYSADAFGTFGALPGNVFADELDFENEWLPEARRYYSNIVGKYGNQVKALLDKAAKLDIELICPLHGPIWRKNIGGYIEKYRKWSAYLPEESSVLIIYASVYGHTENAANIIASKLSERGIKNIAMYDVSKTHPSYIVSEAFRRSHIVFASTTYNAGIFCNMETVLRDLREHNLQNRVAAIVENGTWAPTAGKLMRGILCEMKNITVLDCAVTIMSSVKEEQLKALNLLANALADDILLKSAADLGSAESFEDSKIDKSAFFKIGYGLYVLSAKQREKDNACIINTVIQITDSPKRLAFAVNKANLTRDMTLETMKFCVSALSESAPFELYKRYGFQSGRNVDKLAGENIGRCENGLAYLKNDVCAYIAGNITSAVDYGTHTLFVADVTEAKTLSGARAVTYQYYFDNVKPKPNPPAEVKKGFVCKICGYIHEGDELPEDFICPLCKHGAADFERL